MKHAYSGGKTTLEQHRELGGNLAVDVSYQYLLYFCDDDTRMKEIAHNYRSGKMLSGEIKTIMADYVCEIVKKHQENRAQITPEVLRHFFQRNRSFDNSRREKAPLELETDEVYGTYGINFDKSFGAKPSLEAIKYESHNGWQLGVFYSKKILIILKVNYYLFKIEYEFFFYPSQSK